MLNIFSLKDKYAVITGSVGLLGQKHAEAVLLAGGTPILTDIDNDKLVALSRSLSEEFERPVPWYNMDVSDETSILKVRNQLSQSGIFVSILINNAARNPGVSNGQLASSGRLEAFEPSDFLIDVNVGLVGSVLCAKVFGSMMAERSEGSIINIASDLGVIAPDQRLYRRDGLAEEEQNAKPISYSIVKHGVVGITKYLATYWADRNVRCNSISPGGISNGQGREFQDRISKLVPMGRMANIDEIQGAIIFLSSSASSYINGINLLIDGGRSTW